MIKIGVSACFFYPDTTRNVFGPKTLVYLENDMATYLSRPDVLPVLIPDLYGDDMYHFLNKLDAFIFQGGTDMAPESYGEQPIEEARWNGDIYRDEYELAVLDWAIKNGKPVLGICRGFQVMNVYFGGTLYQDLPTQLPESKEHRCADRYDQLHHHIRFTKGELFESIHESESSDEVNSVHHQGIKNMGKELTVQAVSRDDHLIEAFTWNGAEPGKVMGVQWHPEFFHNFAGDAHLINQDLVYDYFLKFCRRES